MNVIGNTKAGRTSQAVDFDRFRLRRFIDEIAALGELETHVDPVDLADVADKLEGNTKAVLCSRCRAGTAGAYRQRHGQPQTAGARVR